MPKIKDFTGIDDPYEAPQYAEITLDTENFTPQENSQRILRYLAGRGFIRNLN